MGDHGTYQYNFIVIYEPSRFINFTGFVVCFLSALLFLREQLTSPVIVFPYLAGAGLISILLFLNYYSSGRGKRIYYSKVLLIAGLVWMYMPYLQWLIVVFAAMALLEYQAKHDLTVRFFDNEIVFDKVLKKKYRWKALNNVVLKDGVLTLDFRNNRILQKEIDSAQFKDSESVFNAWCKNKLN